MTNITEPHDAVTGNDELTDKFGDGELTSLVRRWMAAGSTVQDRVRRDSVLRVAPPPATPEPVTDPVAVEDTQEAAEEAATVDEAADLRAPSDALDGPLDDITAEADAPLRFPTLPRRTTADVEATSVSRIAVLVDARRVSPVMATGLLARLAERGSVNVFRAYADWGRHEVAAWARQVPVEGLHSFHQFPDDDEQALVALAIDAVDIARGAAVDEVVIAGDLTAALPLVHRLHAAGVRVVAVGAGRTPFDVRAAADAFIDLGLVEPGAVVTAGRHRA